MPARCVRCALKTTMSGECISVWILEDKEVSHCVKKENDWGNRRRVLSSYGRREIERAIDAIKNGGKSNGATLSRKPHDRPRASNAGPDRKTRRALSTCPRLRSGESYVRMLRARVTPEFLKLVRQQALVDRKLKEILDECHFEDP